MQVANAAPEHCIIGINIKFNKIFTTAPTIPDNRKPLLSLLTVYVVDKNVASVQNNIPINK